jgi:hypothetical protein
LGFVNVGFEECMLKDTPYLCNASPHYDHHASGFSNNKARFVEEPASLAPLTFIGAISSLPYHILLDPTKDLTIPTKYMELTPFQAPDKTSHSAFSYHQRICVKDVQ